MSLVAVIPAYNEESKIASTVSKTKHYVDEVVVVDDGSSDNTVGIARNSGARVISHKANKGAGAAIRTGLKYAVKNGYSVAVVLGGDDQDNPSEIPLLLKAIEDGSDFVQGSRYKKGIRNQPLFRIISTKLFSAFFSFVVGHKVTDASNGFRAFRTHILEKIDLSPKWLDKYELEPYLQIQALKKGYRYKEVPVSKYFNKEKGYTKMTPIISWYRICRPMFRELFQKP